MAAICVSTRNRVTESEVRLYVSCVMIVLTKCDRKDNTISLQL